MYIEFESLKFLDVVLILKFNLLDESLALSDIFAKWVEKRYVKMLRFKDKVSHWNITIPIYYIVIHSTVIIIAMERSRTRPKKYGISGFPLNNMKNPFYFGYFITYSVIKIMIYSRSNFHEVDLSKKTLNRFDPISGISQADRHLYNTTCTYWKLE